MTNIFCGTDTQKKFAQEFTLTDLLPSLKKMRKAKTSSKKKMKFFNFELRKHSFRVKKPLKF